MAQLDDQHRHDLYRDGLTIVPGVVPLELVERARRAINSRLSKGISDAEAGGFANGICFPDLGSSRVITDLFAPAKPVVEALTGPLHPCHSGQIALRFPGAMCTDEESFCPAPFWQQAWHLDGMPHALPSLPAGRLGHFTALVGVCLADVQTDFAGNFVAYKGTHRLMAEHFQQNGLDDVLERGQEALPKHLPFPPPTQVKIRAGDVSIAHYNLAHSIAPNASPNVRYMIYFRVFSEAHSPPGSWRPEAVLNPWADWHGMHMTAALNDSGAPAASQVEPRDVEVASLLPDATAAFDAEDWPAARPLFARLAELRPDRFDFQFKAGAAHAWGGDASTRPQAERYLTAAIRLCRSLAAPRAALVVVLCMGGKQPEAAAEFDEMLRTPSPASLKPWEQSAVTHAWRALSGLLAARGAAAQIPGKHQALVLWAPGLREIVGEPGGVAGAGGPPPATAVSKVLQCAVCSQLFAPPAGAPQCSCPGCGRVVDLPRQAPAPAPAPPAAPAPPPADPRLTSGDHARARAGLGGRARLADPSSAEVQQLWREGTQLLQAPQKDWARGQALFSRLCELQPDMPQAHALCGACFTYDRGGGDAHAGRGEPFLRRALELDPRMGMAYGALARNLMRQGRPADAAAMAEAMTVNASGSIDQGAKHAVLDGLRAGLQGMSGRSAGDRAALVARFKERFPALGREADGVVRQAGGCVVS